nr:reverse transcriptase domain-containing protein [Tanacetum cinerariifolium]
MVRRVDNFMKSEEAYKSTELPKGDNPEKSQGTPYRPKRPPRTMYDGGHLRTDNYNNHKRRIIISRIVISKRRKGTNTNDCYQLKRQLEVALESGKLNHLVKDVRQWGNNRGRQPRNKNGKGRVNNMVWERNDSRKCFSEEQLIPIWKVELEVTFRSKGLCRRTMMKFMVVRVSSPYNIILGRTGIRVLKAISSTIHAMMKFPTPRGVATLVVQNSPVYECRWLEKKKVVQEEKDEEAVREEQINSKEEKNLGRRGKPSSNKRSGRMDQGWYCEAREVSKLDFQPSVGEKGSLEDILRLRRRNERVPFDQRNNPPQSPRIVYLLILDINYFRYFLVTLKNLYPIDDEPTWADRVVALTPGSTITIPETANKFAIKARMDAMTIKLDAQYKELQSRAKKTTPNLDKDDMPMSREEEAKFMQTFRKTYFYNDHRDQDSNHDNWRSSGRNDYNRDNCRSNTDDKPYDLQKLFNDFMKSQQSTNAFVKETFMDLKTQLKTVAKNHQASIQNLKTKFDRLTDKQSGRPSGSLPSNTQPNPRGRKSKAYQPPRRKQNPPFLEGTLLEEQIFFEFDELMEMTANEYFKSESDTEEPPFEKITINTDYKIKTTLEESHTDLKLKPLHDNLEYVFLEEPSFLPDRKCTENVAADHLSGIEIKEISDDSEVDDNFPGETLMEINTRDEPCMIRRCISGLETQTILDQCLYGPTGGHYGPNVTAKKENKDDYQWTEDAERAFQEMKKLIIELPTLTTPVPKETLFVYLPTSKDVVSVVLMVDHKGRQTPIWLRWYFGAHPIKVITDQPIKQILNKPEVSSKLAKYTVELGAYNITYVPRNAIKGQLNFPCTNNEIDYEALLVSLRIAYKMKVQALKEVLVEVMDAKFMDAQEINVILEEEEDK